MDQDEREWLSERMKKVEYERSQKKRARRRVMDQNEGQQRDTKEAQEPNERLY